MKWLRTIAVAGIAMASLLTAARAQDKVNLRLDWVFGTEHSGVFVAQEKGFFKEENLEVRIMPGEGSSVTVKLVGNGDADFGYATADQALLANARGLPVVTTAVILQSSATGIVFPKKTGIKKLTDLYGKRLGLQLKSAVERQWRVVAKINNLDTKQINEVPADLAVAQLIIAGKIDAGVAFFFNDGLRPVVEGIPMDWILFSDVGLPMYSSSLITNQNMIDKKPDVVARFTRAFVRGWEYAKAHPDEAYALSIKAQPTLDNAYNKLKLPAVLSLLDSPDAKKNGLGHSTAEGWQALQKALIDSEVLKEPVDLNKVYTTKFLPAAKS